MSDNRKHLACAAIAAAFMTFAVAPAAYAQIQGDFAAADANHDGRVTLQEFQAYATQKLMAANGPMAQRFKQMNPVQQAKIIKKRFDRTDTSQKGYLTPQDWSGS